MSDPYSIDNLQKTLSDSIFADRTDAKKASGRALGTVLELITFYLFRHWGMTKRLCIERRIPEYNQPEITHNVEFSLHPITKELVIDTKDWDLPISSTKLINSLDEFVTQEVKEKKTNNQLLSSRLILRNCALVSETDDSLFVAHVNHSSESSIDETAVVLLQKNPYAIVECKRVGIEEGQKRGPTTIEKAKQGAYVARTVSRLQRLTGSDGEKLGYFPEKGSQGEVRPYIDWMEDLSDLTKPLPDGVVLTIGIVSNHGNWYTHESMHKELKVLSGSYDWLLFLSDEGLSKFVKETIIEPLEEYKEVQRSFLRSYNRDGQNQGNSFTKVKIDIAASHAVDKYFSENLQEIEEHVSVVAPIDKDLSHLKKTLSAMAQKTEQ
tara:strand:- start:1980 stop:3119 length:1140 start_codon:yes stop_codon:yes gene_type:complete